MWVPVVDVLGVSLENSVCVCVLVSDSFMFNLYFDD